MRITLPLRDQETGWVGNRRNRLGTEKNDLHVGLMEFEVGRPAGHIERGLNMCRLGFAVKL